MEQGRLSSLVVSSQSYLYPWGPRHSPIPDAHLGLGGLSDLREVSKLDPLGAEVSVSAVKGWWVWALHPTHIRRTQGGSKG